MKENYLNILKKYNVKSIFHFTNINNLESIIINGICNRKYMNDNSIDYVYTDKNRYDNQINCISLSIGSINKSMFLYKVKSNYGDYIIFELDAYKLISNYYNKIYYCKYNASSDSVIKLLNNNKEYLKTIKAFENMFNNGIINNQAELLLEGKIPFEYVSNIYVDSLKIKMIVEELLNENDINNINVIIKKEMFYNV